MRSGNRGKHLKREKTVGHGKTVGRGKTVDSGKTVGRGKTNPQLLFLVAGVILLLLAVALRFNVQMEGRAAQKRADLLLAQYRSASHTQQRPPAAVPLEQEKAYDTSILEKYPVMGIVYIPAMELEMPVIKEFTEDLLTVSVCRYEGPEDPAQYGNIVISGHNYVNGAHFGRLHELEVKDSVILTNTNATVYYYVVDSIKTVPASDREAVSALEDGLTLFTCTKKGDRRLVVVCRRAT